MAIVTAETILRANDVSKPVNLTVNATGLAARKLVPDSSVYPIRGQTVTVRGEARQITTMFYPDANASITPRIGSGVSMLGSSYQSGNWDPKPDSSITMKILERCKPFAKELLNEDGEFEVISVNIAFRPGRKGGPRVEMETMMTDEGEEKFVCHEYGHAGGG